MKKNLLITGTGLIMAGMSFYLHQLPSTPLKTKGSLDLASTGLKLTQEQIDTIQKSCGTSIEDTDTYKKCIADLFTDKKTHTTAEVCTENCEETTPTSLTQIQEQIKKLSEKITLLNASSPNKTSKKEDEGLEIKNTINEILSDSTDKENDSENDRVATLTEKLLAKIRSCQKDSSKENLKDCSEDFARVLKTATSKKQALDQEQLVTFYEDHIEKPYIDMLTEARDEDLVSGGFSMRNQKRQEVLKAIQPLLADVPKKYDSIRERIISMQTSLIKSEAQLVKGAFEDAEQYRLKADEFSKNNQPDMGLAMLGEYRFRNQSAYQQLEALKTFNGQTLSTLDRGLNEAVQDKNIGSLIARNHLMNYARETMPTINCLASNPQSCAIVGISPQQAQQLLIQSTNSTMPGQISLTLPGTQSLTNTSGISQQMVAPLDNNSLAMPPASGPGVRFSATEMTPTPEMLSQAQSIRARYGYGGNTFNNPFNGQFTGQSNFQPTVQQNNQPYNNNFFDTNRPNNWKSNWNTGPVGGPAVRPGVRSN